MEPKTKYLISSNEERNKLEEKIKVISKYFSFNTTPIWVKDHLASDVIVRSGVQVENDRYCVIAPRPGFGLSFFAWKKESLKSTPKIIASNKNSTRLKIEDFLYQIYYCHNLE